MTTTSTMIKCYRADNLFKSIKSYIEHGNRIVLTEGQVLLGEVLRPLTLILSTCGNAIEGPDVSVGPTPMREIQQNTLRIVYLGYQWPKPTSPTVAVGGYP